MTKWLGAALALLVAACATDAEPEPLGSSGSFLSSPDDEALDPDDPPTDPDPADPIRTASAGAGAGAVAGCPARSKLLGPKGLTFVIHVSNRAGKAQDELAHLKAVAPFLRARDVFMVERTSPVLDQLQKEFPCNAIHFITFPDDLDRALATGGRIDGIAVDWEGANVDGNSQAFTVDRLASFARKIRAAGKQPGFVPVLPGAFDDGEVTTKSDMDYEIVQIQGRCVAGAPAFAAGARGKLADFKAKNNPLRNMGVEISMDSFDEAQNHVGPLRAADCTRAAFGKGARAVYLYGNGDDHLVPYFDRLHDLGIRHRGS